MDLIVFRHVYLCIVTFKLAMFVDAQMSIYIQPDSITNNYNVAAIHYSSYNYYNTIWSFVGTSVRNV